MDRRSNRVCQLRVQVGRVLHLGNFVALGERELVTDLFLVGLLVIVVALDIGVGEAEARISSMHRVCNENHAVAQVLDTDLLEAGNTVERASIVPLHVGKVSASSGVLFARFQHLNDVGDDDKLTREDGFVTGLGNIDDLTAQNDIDATRHGSGRNLRTVFLEANLLPVNHSAVLVDETPVKFVVALVIDAADWLRVLELLLHIVDDCFAFSALEAADEQLRLRVRRSRHGTRDSGETTETRSAQLPNLGHLRQVEDGHLIQRLLLVVDAGVEHASCTTSLLVHELGERGNEVALILVELGHDHGHEARVSVVEAAEMSKVNVHCGGLVAEHAVRLMLVVPDGSAITSLLVGDARKQTDVLRVVLGVTSQLKAITKKVTNQDNQGHLLFEELHEGRLDDGAYGISVRLENLLLLIVEQRSILVLQHA